MGRWVLTGSQQLALTRPVTQSLAGRVAQLELLPFSMAELATATRRPGSLLEAVFRGGYPPLYDDRRELDPSLWLENYLSTFVNRDVRAVLEIRDRASFDRFLRLCASRTGQIVNKSELGTECGVDSKTIDAWLDGLEACYVIRLLRPHHRNFGKRMVKRPKLHFIDSGLACRLLQITDVSQLSSHPLRGALVETWCLSEILKSRVHRAKLANLWFWGSGDGLEVDVLVEHGQSLTPIEIKSGLTPFPNAAAGIEKLRALSARDTGVTIERGLIVFGGDEPRTGQQADFVPWHEIAEAIGHIP